MEPEVSGFKSLFFFWGGGGAPKLITAINTCLDEMEHSKKSLQEKVFKSESAKINNYFYRLYVNDVDFLYNDSSCGFVPQ